ncbi:hypothetical protein [Streptomyces sp. NRRL WC-3742]|uniref:hypothetical protein n=1 Tax=Streptomyces sp. NRRL WC-3742 TaxID=1463934 RepID=UPI0004C7779F|nr:hypothetical protein [Streptomyces sp. NRRL WC-3742]
MRALLEVDLDTETSNKLIKDGTAGSVIQQILGQLKPEASYFLARNGRRSMVLIVDLTDEPSVVTTCEPFWVQLGAEIALYPCMNTDDLAEGLKRLAEAAASPAPA